MDLQRPHSGAGSEVAADQGIDKQPTKFRQRTVLIVDDQFTGRAILEQLVHSVDLNLRTESFADPRVALEWANEQTPDLVFTDYKMPAMDGVEFTKRLRQIPACKDVPLIVVTVVENREVRYRALEAGATDFLTRPVDHHECQARCRNLLTMRAQQQIIKNRASWLERQVEMATRQVRTREQETLLRLAKAGEYRDEGTGNHILRMAKFSRQLAEVLGLNAAECDEVEQSAPMHDIGKIGIPDKILLKPGRLNRAEFEVMKTHARIGYEILKDSPSRYLQLGAVIALGHHERFDGSGYPSALRGEEIPLIARIVAVADVFDALTTIRPYKRAWSLEDAIIYIENQSAKHFDPDCVAAFLSVKQTIVEIQQQLKDHA